MVGHTQLILQVTLLDLPNERLHCLLRALLYERSNGMPSALKSSIAGLFTWHLNVESHLSLVCTVCSTHACACFNLDAYSACVKSYIGSHV
jgi:hypothetical protein